MSERRELPGPEEDPSADVLDELLRAFSADETDTGVLAKIDLTSPEVDALIGGRRAEPEPEPVAEDAVEPAADGPADDAAADDAAGDAAADEQPADAEPGHAEPPDGPIAADDELDAADDVIDEVDVDRGAQPGDDAATDAERGDEGDEVDDSADDAVVPDSPPARPTIVIGDADADAGSEIGDPDGASFVVAGDPLLGGPSDDEARDETDPPGGVGGGRVVSIVDRGLPDAVYVSGDVDDSRSTVFIDDQDGLVGAATTISIEDATSATKIEPRLRERRIAVKRAAGRKRLRWMVAIAAVVVLVVAGLAVLGSGVFAVEDVEVLGAEHTDKEALAAVVEDLEGTPVLLVDTGAAERTLEAIPWVERARVTTQFPHGARIELVERTPVVNYQGPDGTWRVLDGDGRVLSTAAAADPELVPITGVNLTDLALGTFDQRLSAAATLVRALGDLRADATSVSISVDSADLRLLLADGTEVRFGQAEDLITKLVRLRAKLKELEGDSVRYIDVATAEIGTG